MDTHNNLLLTVGVAKYEGGEHGTNRRVHREMQRQSFPLRFLAYDARRRLVCTSAGHRTVRWFDDLAVLYLERHFLNIWRIIQHSFDSWILCSRKICCIFFIQRLYALTKETRPRKTVRSTFLLPAGRRRRYSYCIYCWNTIQNTIYITSYDSGQYIWLYCAAAEWRAEATRQQCGPGKFLDIRKARCAADCFFFFFLEKVDRSALLKTSRYNETCRR